MAYNNFTLDMLIQQFGLRIVSKANTFAEADPVLPSALLRETLAETVPLALEISTEKARSELIISPVLVEARRQFLGQISLFSGVDFTVDAETGLAGVCDFLFSLSPLQLVVQAPVIAIVEAKNDNIKSGLGQCAAEMLAAQKFNTRRGTEMPTVYGIVTSGSLWKFLRLSGIEVIVDETEYHIEQIEIILGILVFMVREALEQQSLGEQERTDK
jgi:hypothetical protein